MKKIGIIFLIFAVIAAGLYFYISRNQELIMDSWYDFNVRRNNGFPCCFLYSDTLVVSSARIWTRTKTRDIWINENCYLCARPKEFVHKKSTYQWLKNSFILKGDTLVFGHKYKKEIGLIINNKKVYKIRCDSVTIYSSNGDTLVYYRKK